MRSTDQLASHLQAQRAGGDREVARLRDSGALRDDLNLQLKAALARESERVAKAWEQRESLRAALQKRDDSIESMRAELSAAKEVRRRVIEPPALLVPWQPLADWLWSIMLW